MAETYTKEQAEYAQNFSNNPQKYISNDKISSDIKEIKETSHERK